MTVSSTHNEISYTASAGATVFPYTFLILASADLLVYKDTVLQVSGYTVSSVGVGSGGNVTFTTPLVGGEVVRLLRSTEITQEVDLLEGSRLPADQTEGMWDKLTLITQDLDGRLDDVADEITNITIGTPNLVESTLAGLPTPGVSGLLRHVTDDVRGIWMDTGTQWFSTAGEVVNVKEFGAVGDGVTDDSAAVNAAFAELSRTTEGGRLVFPPGAYLFTSQVAWTPHSDYQGYEIIGYGAELLTTGAISALQINPGGGGMKTLRGFMVNHRNNTTATYGFDIIGATRLHLIDCSIISNNTAATYAAVRLTDTATQGCYWNHLQNLFIRKWTGGDPGTTAIGVLIEAGVLGGGNATTIRGGLISNCDTGILIRNTDAVGYIPNGIVITEVDFETDTVAIAIRGTVLTSNIAGHRIINNRAESVGTFFAITGITAQPSIPPWLAGNALMAPLTTYVNNPNNLFINTFDFSITPDLGRPFLRRGLQIQPLGGSERPLEIIAPGGSRGVHVLSGASGSSAAVQLVWAGVGTRGRISGTAPGATAGIDLANIASISGAATVTPGFNLRGTLTISNTATEGAVTFGTAEPDATYFLALGVHPSTSAPGVAAWIKTGTKATTGFTVELSGSPGSGNTMVINWILLR